MSVIEVIEYEAKVWPEGDGWVAKLLHNGMYHDSRSRFATRDEALAWARDAAAKCRADAAAEAEAERVPV